METCEEPAGKLMLLSVAADAPTAKADIITTALNKKATALFVIPFIFYLLLFFGTASVSATP